MIQELAARAPAGRARPVHVLSRLLARTARRLLRWEPVGCLMIELPDGSRIRFGQPSSGEEAFIRLHNFAVLGKALRRRALGFAEAYLDGDIDCPDLVALFRFFLRNRDRLAAAGDLLPRFRIGDRLMHLARRNSRMGSRRNISAHYDLGNDFYRLWLDPDMNYSSGLYARGAATLEQAQSAKIGLVLEMLELADEESILEIGCGWGAFARQAARNTGVRVKGITLSREQLSHARRQSAHEGLSASCRFFLEDYRDVSGRYDRIVSIEMVEAVGAAYWPRYFQVLNDRLKENGCAVIQAITIDERRFEAYRRNPDFIQRHIFPGGMLPTPAAIQEHAERAGLRLERVERFGHCYARTLREWRRRFEAAWPEISRQGFDERFRRKWRYYLAYCEAGFLHDAIDVGLYRLRKSVSAAAS